MTDTMTDPRVHNPYEPESHVAPDTPRVPYKIRMFVTSRGNHKFNDDGPYILVTDAERLLAEQAAETTKWRRACADLDLYRQTLTADRDRLRAALESYGQHGLVCPAGSFGGQFDFADRTCTCGLAAALAGTQADDDEAIRECFRPEPTDEDVAPFFDKFKAGTRCDSRGQSPVGGLDTGTPDPPCERCGGGGTIDYHAPHAKDTQDVSTMDCPDCAEDK